MEAGRGFETINPWGLSMFRTLQAVEPATAAEQSAYDAWLAQTSAREEARRDRLHAAEGVVPQPLWIVLLLSAVLVLVYVLFFADSGERAVVQGLMAGSVTAVVVASLLVLSSLNRPYDTDVGGIRPVAMQRSLETIASARAALDLDDPLPCDAAGQAAVSVPRQERSTADRRIDTMAAVLLAVAAVATAWSSYQASRWTGEQAKAFATASASRVESTRVVEPRERPNADRRRRLHPMGRCRVSAARPSSPRSTSNGSATSSSPPSKHGSAPTRSRIPRHLPPRSRWTSTDWLRPRRRTSSRRPPRRRPSWPGRTSSARPTTCSGSVLFATSLFFAGISTKLNSTRLRGVILGVGCVVFVSAASWIATFPISLSI